MTIKIFKVKHSCGHVRSYKVMECSKFFKKFGEGYAEKRCDTCSRNPVANFRTGTKAEQKKELQPKKPRKDPLKIGKIKFGDEEEQE